jgi:heme-degrading monooxygenase HmoA
MKQLNIRNRFSLWLSVLAVPGFLLTATASAAEVVVLSHYQERSGKGAELSKVMDSDVITKLAGVKGLQSAKFFYNPKTGERGSVFIWQSQADWEAYSKSGLRQELVGKMKPFLKGGVTSKSYPVYEPKK